MKKFEEELDELDEDEDEDEEPEDDNFDWFLIDRQLILIFCFNTQYLIEVTFLIKNKLIC